MDSLVSGTMAGAGSFRCESCGYVVTQAAHASLEPCPSCGARQFARASLFAAGRFSRPKAAGEDEREAILSSARSELTESGPHIVFHDSGVRRLVALSDGTARIGRSLTAEIRFDDQTVSRKHALLVTAGESVRVLDDRSLNGVFVNGERVEDRLLQDGDELVVGRHRLHFLDGTSVLSGMRDDSTQNTG